jgi:hypothetical protein
MDDHPRRLVDNQEIVILVENLQRYLLGGHLGLARRRNGERHPVTRPHFVVRGDGSAVQQNAALLDETLDRCAGAPPQPIDEESVKPNPVMDAADYIELFPR